VTDVTHTCDTEGEKALPPETELNPENPPESISGPKSPVVCDTEEKEALAEEDACSIYAPAKEQSDSYLPKEIGENGTSAESHTSTPSHKVNKESEEEEEESEEATEETSKSGASHNGEEEDILNEDEMKGNEGRSPELLNGDDRCSSEEFEEAKSEVDALSPELGLVEELHEEQTTNNETTSLNEMEAVDDIVIHHMEGSRDDASSLVSSLDKREWIQSEKDMASKKAVAEEGTNQDGREDGSDDASNVNKSSRPMSASTGVQTQPDGTSKLNPIYFNF
jgi:hypothetical protein